MFDDSPGGQHGHGIRGSECVAHFLRADERRAAVSQLKRGERVVELRRGMWIEPVAWLVDEQQWWLEDERPRQRRAATIEA